MTARTLQRRFRFGATVLPDPDPSLSPEAAVKLYGPTYPFLMSATLVGPTETPCGLFLEFEAQKPPVATKGTCP
jgi:PRTRC genetic system protein C